MNIYRRNEHYSIAIAAELQGSHISSTEEIIYRLLLDFFAQGNIFNLTCHLLFI